MAAAHTTHGRFSAAGGAARAAERGLLVLLARSDIPTSATILRPYLTPDMEQRLDLDPVELREPAYVSPAAIRTPCAAKPCTVRTGGSGGGRVAGGAAATSTVCNSRRPGQAPGGTSLNGDCLAGSSPTTAALLARREAERVFAREEAAALAPWKAAIALARAAEHEAHAARARAAAAKSHRRQLDRIKRGAAQSEMRQRDTVSGAAPAVSESSAPEAMAQLRAHDLGSADINAMYLALALRVAGLRIRSEVQADGTRAEADLRPGDIDPMEPMPTAPTGWHAPQALLDTSAARFGEVTRTDPIQPEDGR
jgi:hypothetical protein